MTFDENIDEHFLLEMKFVFIGEKQYFSIKLILGLRRIVR